MATTGTGSDITYEAAAGAALPPLEELPAVAGMSTLAEEHLEAEYYDTGGLRLIRAGATLRRDDDGDGAGWHLDLPAGSGGYRQIRVPLGEPSQELPGDLAQLVTAYTRGEDLRPVVHQATRRQRLLLLSQAGDPLAEVADDNVTAETLGTTTTLSRWRTVTVTVTSGDGRLQRAADDLLRRAGLRPAPPAAGPGGRSAASSRRGRAHRSCRPTPPPARWSSRTCGRRPKP